MLIECTIQRERGTFVDLYGKSYHFAPNAEGAHVCEVEDEAAIDAFLAVPEGYRVARKGATPAKRAEPAKAIERDAKTQLPAGAPPDLASMNRGELDQYAVNLGMRKPHPAMKDERVRQNIALWLAERIEDATAPFGVDDAGEEADNEADEEADE